ncbi:hypothetical protein MJO28_011983 [Puccinia striiformis f. sp. tritici]|uniref:Uncharacterized protein n=4 Tax=Puccinia striiformis TaxID=27350 RepID=A0A0L0VD84_9BASI|nr:hypothetical protein Pst134EA_023170 [Puccinia striiformis f. sp. tritici]KAI9631122.1 hypothetical protein KEM48_013258 [Puccinia striiformis f. sp. tritici PST-130]KNE97267.1 hypothetical protein PSTG_09528 [Puccinia striiformis f. sp. tritici PST-78]POV95429.1 hypothetical protein PSTT_16277 [Puccinia striiformis]KAH9446173.1 hypothetical protein Pst134EB_023989 [Puccinia striiformis f. sp. tritici]KAH9455717.1 hypothetical protein Pst134EA_023170 [Puccinia striiformis f. sp. tritici]
MSITPRRSSLGYCSTSLPAARRRGIVEGPLSPTAAIAPERPLPQLFTRAAPSSYSRRSSRQPPSLGSSTFIPTPSTFGLPPSEPVKQSIPNRAATDQITYRSQVGNYNCCDLRNPTGFERSERAQVLNCEPRPTTRAATLSPTSSKQQTPNNTNSSRSMASMYQLVTTKVKGQSCNSSTKSHSIHYAPSFTGSETTSGSTFNGSQPSLTTTLSSQSTNLSSYSFDEASSSYDFHPINPASSATSLKLFRSAPCASINKSFQNLLRKRKQKPSDLNLSQSLTSLNTVTNHESQEIQVPRAVPKSAMFPPLRLSIQTSQPCKSATPFRSFPSHVLEPDSAHDDSESSPTAIFSGSLIVAKDAPLAGIHPREPKSIPRRQESEISSGDDSEMEDMLLNLRNIAAARKPALHVTVEPATPTSPEDEHLEMKDMMKNLQTIAMSRKPEPTADEKNFSESGLEDDQISIDYSDTESESSFDAEVIEDPEEFQLPSWPKLDSTSQSPFNQQSLCASTYRPAECSVSVSMSRKK